MLLIHFYFLQRKAKNGDGYISEPEKGYESDYGENRLYRNSENEHTKRVSIRRS